MRAEEVYKYDLDYRAERGLGGFGSAVCPTAPLTGDSSARLAIGGADSFAFGEAPSASSAYLLLGLMPVFLVSAVGHSLVQPDGMSASPHLFDVLVVARRLFVFVHRFSSRN